MLREVAAWCRENSFFTLLILLALFGCVTDCGIAFAHALGPR